MTQMFYFNIVLNELAAVRIRPTVRGNDRAHERRLRMDDRRLCVSLDHAVRRSRATQQSRTKRPATLNDGWP